ncbi:MAG: hypothetical protein QXW10_04150, partial [Candidatus Micrarchaeaceae archaeon]
GWSDSNDKYKRDIKRLENSALYRHTYGSMVDYFAMPINSGKSTKNFANETFEKSRENVAQNI